MDFDDPNGDAKFDIFARYPNFVLIVGTGDYTLDLGDPCDRAVAGDGGDGGGDDFVLKMTCGDRKQKCLIVPLPCSRVVGSCCAR